MNYNNSENLPFPHLSEELLNASEKIKCRLSEADLQDNEMLDQTETASSQGKIKTLKLTKYL